VQIAFLFVGVRAPTNAAADFPVSHEVTLQPGQSFTYSGARAFPSAGTYAAWAGYSDNSARIELPDTRTQFSVQPVSGPSDRSSPILPQAAEHQQPGRAPGTM
jgi:hypothetical protein